MEYLHININFVYFKNLKIVEIPFKIFVIIVMIIMNYLIMVNVYLYVEMV